MNLIRGGLIKGMEKVIRTQRAQTIVLLRRTARRRKTKTKSSSIDMGHRPDSDSESPRLSESLEHSSSLSAHPLDEIPKKMGYVQKIRNITPKIPGRHKSLIGYQDLRSFLKKKLGLSRLPCNLAEVRRCRQIYFYARYAFDLAKRYSDPSFPDRIYARRFLNIVLRMKFSTVLDHRPRPEDYASGSPYWLYRCIVKALSIGNKF